MSWYDQIRGGPQNQKAHGGPTRIDGISSIPFDATPQARFRLSVDVERVYERTTSAGEPCYFLSCRDQEGIVFSVVAWDWQWARFQGRVKEGTTLALDVRVPRGGYSAFTLA